MSDSGVFPKMADLSILTLILTRSANFGVLIYPNIDSKIYVSEKI